MSDIPSFPYSLLWGERVVRSVANLTRADGELLAVTPQVPSRPRRRPTRSSARTKALADLRAGRFDGAAVLVAAHRAPLSGGALRARRS